ncbi:MAG: FtsX-like permease family protein, partial [Bacteroidales bacterium]
FIGDNIKARRSKIVGIYNNDFEDYDKLSVIGSISLIQQVNGWHANEGSYISIDIDEKSNIDKANNNIYSEIIRASYLNNSNNLYDVTSTHEVNSQYFAWLTLLDMNVVVILILMSIVSSFTMISGLLILVLERVNMIGVLKALGGTNGTIRNIFILLTQKLIIKSIVIGNLIGLALAYLQSQFKILTLNPDNYYMSFVPVEVNLGYILILNISVIVLAYVTLLAPSYIIASIKPSKAIKFE